MSSGLKDNFDALFGKMENFVSTKTVVGEPIKVGEITLLPIIEVSVGVGAGASESADRKGKDSGAGGLGAKITPSAVLVINGKDVQMINIKNQDAVNKLIDMAPGIVNKLNFGAVFSGRGKNEEVKPDVKFEEEVVVEKEVQ